MGIGKRSGGDNVRGGAPIRMFGSSRHRMTSKMAILHSGTTNHGGMVARGIGILVIGAALLTCLFTGASAGDWQHETARQLEQQLQSPLAGAAPNGPDRHFERYRAVVRFYAYRDYKPAWVDQFGLLPEGAMALAALKQAGNQGLRYADYRNPWLDDLLDGVTTRPVIIGPAFNGKQVQLDLVVTEMVLRYARHRTMGRIDPAMITQGVATEKAARPGSGGGTGGIAGKRPTGRFFCATGTAACGLPGAAKKSAAIPANQNSRGLAGHR